MTKYNYIIFGGTFDPWTPAHEEIVRRLCKKYPNHHIMITPSCVSWHRAGKKPMFSPDDRLAIINNRLRSSGLIHNDVSVSDYEYRFAKIYPGTARGFIDTLQYKIGAWSALEPDWSRKTADVKFVIGLDEWALFPKWKNYQDILKLAEPVVVMRPCKNPHGSTSLKSPAQMARAGENLPARVETLVLDEKFSKISASKIRSMYTGKKVSVEKYCSDRNVWTDDLVPAELLCSTAILKVYQIPSDDPSFRPIRVKTRDWVCVIVDATPERGKEMILRCVRQKRWGTGLVYDEFVTGVIDAGESPLKAAQRELKEELGLDAPFESLKPLGTLATNPGFLTNYMHYFYVRLTEKGIKKTKPSLDPHEKLIPVDITRNELFHDPYRRPALMMAGLTMLASAVSKGEVSCW